MTTTDIKTIYTRFFDVILNQGNVDTLDEFLADNWVNHYLVAGIPPTKAGFGEWIVMMHATIANLHYTIEDLIISGDKVVSRVSVSGTQTGEFLGIPPSNKTFSMTGINIEGFSNGKMVEHWAEYDILKMMQQLGAIPTPEN